MDTMSSPQPIHCDNQIVVSTEKGGTCDFYLKLEKGWNLVSIPKPIDEINATKLFNLSEGEAACYWDAGTHKWIINGNITVKPCQGYWVYKNKSETICINYSKSIMLPPSQELYQGWNLIGHIDDIPWNVWDFLNVTDLGEKTLIIYTITEQGLQNITYQCFFPSVPAFSEFDEMLPGWGYWIFVKEDALMPGTVP